jgi:hypothetical protein
MSFCTCALIPSSMSCAPVTSPLAAASNAIRHVGHPQPLVPATQRPQVHIGEQRVLAEEPLLPSVAQRGGAGQRESEAERNQISTRIQSYAAQWANSITLVQVPGLRASRDAYCAQQLGGG